MDATGVRHRLPPSTDPDLHLMISTNDELAAIYKLSFAEWGDTLTLPQFIEGSDYLTEVPLAKDGGMVSWILTIKNMLPNRRPTLCSCETFRKRAFVAAKEGELSEQVVYGVASISVNLSIRRRGFTKRLTHELAQELPRWRVEAMRPVASIFYSDIGTDYYTDLGWLAFPVNRDLEFDVK